MLNQYAEVHSILAAVQEHVLSISAYMGEPYTNAVSSAGIDGTD
jgi:hypothetical protein